MDTVFNLIDVWLIKLNSNLTDKMILINIGPNDWSTSLFKIAFGYLVDWYLNIFTYNVHMLFSGERSVVEYRV